MLQAGPQCRAVLFLPAFVGIVASAKLGQWTGRQRADT